MNKKGFLQIPFAWLFAIIAGSFILVLAIIATTKIVDQGEEVVGAKTAKEVGILLHPLETGFETGKTNHIIFPTETRIHNRCDEDDPEFFGEQIIKISQKSFDKWTETDIDVGFQNKYIFSRHNAEGRKFYLFSKPFDFPFKVADLIYLTSSKEEYCFINPPPEIEEEIGKNGDEGTYFQENIKIDEDCPENNINVCFSSTSSSINCDIYVNYKDGSGKVEKDRKTMYFETNALMYGAIFSDPEIYECQVRRLMLRTEQLAILYQEKAGFVTQKVGCNSNLELSVLAGEANRMDSSGKFPISLLDTVDDIKNKNEDANCRLW